jgi:outer membrane lipoprotein-sorting protein
MTRLTTAAFAMFLPLLLSGCITTEEPAKHEIHSLADLDAELAKRRAAIHDLLLATNMKVEGLEHSGAVTAYINCEPPDRFRMDATKRMGPTLFVFVMVKDKFVINVAIEGKWLRGEVKSQQKDHQELVAAFAWLEERLEPGDERTLSEDDADHLSVVTKRAGKPVRTTLYDRATLFATRIVFFGEDGSETASVALSDYRAVKPAEARPGPSAWIPWKITVSGRGKEGKPYTVETTISRVDLNDGIKPEAWNMEIPAGATVEDAK